MSTREPIAAIDWDRHQWANSTRATRTKMSPRWSLWQWASVRRPRSAVALGLGESALSGFGHNPGGQHWVEQRGRIDGSTPATDIREDVLGNLLQRVVLQGRSPR
jgi:hypothetical protein